MMKNNMNYSLTKTDIEKEKQKGVLTTAWKRLVPLMAEEAIPVTIAFLAILMTSATTLVVPIIIAHIIDVYIITKNFHGVLIVFWVVGNHFYFRAYFKLHTNQDNGRGRATFAF